MITKQHKNLLYYYILFNVYPIIVIIQNLSAYFFPFLIFKYVNSEGNLFLKKTNFVDRIIIFLIAGIFISLLGSVFGPVENGFVRSLEVLPNYLYWMVVMLFLSSYAKRLDYLVIYKAVFWGIIIGSIHFYLLDPFLKDLPIIKYFTQNLYSFLLISFCSMFVYYAEQKFGRVWAYVAAILIVVLGASSGSRSGSLLTLLNCLITLFAGRLKTKNILFIILFIATLPIIMELSIVKSTVFSLNERTYKIVYETADVRNEDESYLIRVAQVEKGLAIFKKYPLWGVGLNNWILYDHNFLIESEVLEKVQKKHPLDRLSSHNSYINILSEGGLVMFVPFIGLIVSLFLYLILNFKKIPDFQKPFFYGIIGVSIHLYFITAIVNVFIWVLFGLAAASVRYNSFKK